MRNNAEPLDLALFFCLKAYRDEDLKPKLS